MEEAASYAPYSSRRRRLSFVLVFGLSIFCVLRSSQTLSSLQNQTKENLGKIYYNQTEEDKSDGADDRRQEHHANRGTSDSSAHFWEQEDNPTCFHLDRICQENGEWFYDVPNNHTAISSRIRLHQPSIKYSMLDVPDEYDPDERYIFNVVNTTSYNRTCPYSST